MEEVLYLALINVHGLIRAKDLELGRDADTGGQTKYVYELALALSHHPKIRKVEIWTRLIADANVSADYAVHREEIGPKVAIVRFPCGPRRYLYKERLWPHLDTFADQAFRYIRSQRQMPDFLHAHYADAGYVASRLTGLLGVPMALQAIRSAE